jgi:hypothetical protein
MHPQDKDIIFCRKWHGEVTRGECGRCWDRMPAQHRGLVVSRLACRLREIKTTKEVMA